MSVTRASLRTALPWLKKFVKLFKLGVAIMPIAGTALHGVLTIVVPDQLQREWDAQKDSVGSGVDDAIKAIDGIEEYRGKNDAAGTDAADAPIAGASPGAYQLTAADAGLLASKVEESKERVTELRELSAELFPFTIGGLTWTRGPDGKSFWLCEAHRTLLSQ